jgi:hypothetical protein
MAATKEYLKQYYAANKDKAKAYMKAYYEAKKNDPDYKAKKAEYSKQYRQRSDVKSKNAAYSRAYSAMVRQTPGFKAKKRVWQKDRYERLIARNEALFADFWKNGCTKCGWNESKAGLDAHHINPADKDIEVSKLLKLANQDRIRAELAKCICVCANCHRKIHAGEI